MSVLKQLNSTPFLVCAVLFLATLLANLSVGQSTVGVPLSQVASHLTPPPEELKVGEPAPNLQLKNVYGKTVSLRSYRGRYVLLYFTSDCTPCSLANVSDLDTLYANRMDAAVFIISPEDRLSLLKLKTQLGYDGQLFPRISATVRQQYKVHFQPRLYAVDRQGNISYVQPAGATKAQIQADIKQLIG